MNKATGTQTTIANSASKGLIVHNRSAGDGEADKLQAQLRGQLGAERFDLLELDDEMPLCKVLGSSVQKHDYKWIAAAGGDGTVSKVGGCLVNLDLPLAIIPAGTGNAIAGALGIPEDVEQACRLLQGGVSTRTLDAIQVGQQFFFLQ
jgi:diacylglycerol kinase family enzyme